MEGKEVVEPGGSAVASIAAPGEPWWVEAARPKGAAPERYDWDGGSFKAYMREKNRKLQEQNEKKRAVRSSDAGKTHRLFEGLAIHVSGRTLPGREEIRDLVVAHGGRYETYFTPASCTHFVCSSISFAKAKQMKTQRHRVHVVSADWITKSLQAGTLLAVSEFFPDCVQDPGQTRLRFGSSDGGNSMAPKVSTGLSEEENEQHNDEDDDGQEGSEEEATEPPVETARSLRTTSENPDFVRQFFQQSRLHFIGSFRARYEHYLGIVARNLGLGSAADLVRGNPTLPQKSTPSYGCESGSTGSSRVFVHVDMDCFFASVAENLRPELKGKPLVVCHSSNSGPNSDSRGEISSANYAARSFGIKAGMFLRKAQQLCPTLVSVPYDFAEYERLSVCVMTILFKYAWCVQVSSVDEAYIDVTDQPFWPVRCVRGGIDSNANQASPPRHFNPAANAELFCAHIRAEIQRVTGCTASAGIGRNMLLARVATMLAKPNGQFRIQDSEALAHISSLALRDLPGLGYRTREKLAEEFGVHSVRELVSISRARLQQTFGEHAGAQLYDGVRGETTDIVQPLKPRRSISAAIGWGVRFGSPSIPSEREKAALFVAALASEVADRLQLAGALAKRVSVDFLRKRPGAGPPFKPLGHGICDRFSFSGTLAEVRGFTEDSFAKQKANLCAVTREFWQGSNIPSDELRGVSVHASNLKFEATEPGHSVVGMPNVVELFERMQKGGMAVKAVSGRAGVSGRKRLRLDDHDGEDTGNDDNSGRRNAKSLFRAADPAAAEKRRLSRVQLQPTVVSVDSDLRLSQSLRLSKARREGYAMLGADAFHGLPRDQAMQLIHDIDVNYKMQGFTQMQAISRMPISRLNFQLVKRKAKSREEAPVANGKTKALTIADTRRVLPRKIEESKILPSLWLESSTELFNPICDWMDAVVSARIDSRLSEQDLCPTFDHATGIIAGAIERAVAFFRLKEVSVLILSMRDYILRNQCRSDLFLVWYYQVLDRSSQALHMCGGLQAFR
ncbi:DNA repair protein REV1 [Porphyridium purpureum]|uniref:DNA repair protein REV1 n=1 Tax=Porphyridium purpureum TaxID=35688 RepID=A0A5J4Z827_PORPP|nr:DNA repair protein REV1 [Porphyridium purpureum]|eukprot:POR1101..scf295_1